MAPMRLEVQAPALGVVTVGRFARTGMKHIPVETIVIGLRRLRKAGGDIDDAAVHALAYLKPELMACTDKNDGHRHGAEHYWCVARVEDNRKSLRAFMESGDMEWLTPEAPRG